MTSSPAPGESPAQRVFGPQAGVYAESPVHAGDPSLDALVSLASQNRAEGYDWALDLGTGAGGKVCGQLVQHGCAAGNEHQMHPPPSEPPRKLGSNAG